MDFTAILQSACNLKKRVKRYDIPPPKIVDYFLKERSRKNKVILVSKSSGKRFYGR